MAAKTLDEFYKEYRSGFNPITGKQNLFKDLTDEMIWNAAIKSVEKNGSSHNSDYTKLCPSCKKNEMSHYATNLYCQSCGHIIT